MYNIYIPSLKFSSFYSCFIIIEIHFYLLMKNWKGRFREGDRGINDN